MLHFSRLGYYVLPQLPPGYIIPQWLSMEVAIFAGRLYLDFLEYQSIMKFFRLTGSNFGAVDGSRELSVKDPVNFIREWLALCRKGQDITHTPMGYVCGGRQLHWTHPFFLAPRSQARESGGIDAWNQSGSEVDSDEGGG